MGSPSGSPGGAAASENVCLSFLDPGKTPTPTAAPVWALQRRQNIRENIGVSATQEKLQLLLRRLSGHCRGGETYEKT